MFKVCSKGCDRGHESNQQRPPAIAPRSLRVVGRSRQSFATIVTAANPATVKTDSATLSAAPGRQGRAVKLEEGVA